MPPEVIAGARAPPLHRANDRVRKKEMTPALPVGPAILGAPPVSHTRAGPVLTRLPTWISGEGVIRPKAFSVFASRDLFVEVLFTDWSLVFNTS